MPQGWRPTHPGDPTPEWGPLGRSGCIVFSAVVIVILAIAFLVGATRSSGDSELFVGAAHPATFVPAEQ